MKRVFGNIRREVFRLKQVGFWLLLIYVWVGTAVNAGAALRPVVTERGKISISADAIGTALNTGVVQVEKPSVGAILRKSILTCASLSGWIIRDGDVAVDGVPISWDLTAFGKISRISFFHNVYADITAVVKSKIDAAVPGRINFTISENFTQFIDGCILFAIFDDPTQVLDHTVILMFGSQALAGDSFTINLADPINRGDPNLVLDFGLGISFGAQGFRQFSTVDVNGNRLTTSAGGQDDGVSQNGALITVGGLDDSNDNPPFPFLTPLGDPRIDDELYSLIPFTLNGDQSIKVDTTNPSNDDNIFFAYVFTSGLAAVGPSLTNVRLIDTISTTNIDLDPASFSTPPTSITVEAGQTVIEWQFAAFFIDQIKDLSFDVILKNPFPGEDRLVNHKLEILYTDVNGNPVRTELGPQFVNVLASAFDTTVSTDKAQYTANENVLIDLSITNLSGFARTVDAVVEIEDSLGNPVEAVTVLAAEAFLAGETKIFPGLIFNTGSTFAGDYRVHIRLIEAGIDVGEAFANFTIAPVIQAASTIVTDKISYSSNETVTLSSSVTSQSPNATLTNLDATVTVSDSLGVLLFTEPRALADLLPGAGFSYNAFFNTSTLPAGLYTATLQVNTNGVSLTTSTADFEIISSLEQANALSGTLEVIPNSILETEGTTLTYSIQNTGNEFDLPLISIEILVVDPDTQLAVRTLTDQMALNGREIFIKTIQFDSNGLAPKPYLVVLRGTTAGITQTLASAGLQINPIPNTAPTAVAGTNQLGLTGQPILLDGTGSTDPDGDPLAFSWDFISIPATSQLTQASLTNVGSSTPTFIPDVDGIYVLSLVVNDGLIDSAVDTVSVFINPAPTVDIHPEVINLKSNGASKSVTGVLTSPVLSAYEFFTAADGVTVTATFKLENRYIDKNGATVVFTIPADVYPGDDTVVPVDADGNGTIDLHQLTLKFNRDLIIAGVNDANQQLLITQPTDLVSTVIATVGGVDILVGSDTNIMIHPPAVKLGGPP